MVPHERFVMSTSDGPFPMETTYTWQGGDGGLTKDEAAQPRRAGRLLQGRSPRDGERDAPREPQDLEALKRILEES
jgi:hypothetical protein